MAGYDLTREERLAKLNSMFEAYELPPWELANIGDAANGECEVLDALDVRELGRGRIEIQLRIRTPDGHEPVVNARFGGRLVYVIPLLTLVDAPPEESGPQVCLTRRWRVERGGWTLEIPHGLDVDDRDSDRLSALDSPAHRILARIFGEEAIEALGAARVVPLGPLLVKGENALADGYLLVATIMTPFKRRVGDGEPVLTKWSAMLQLVDGQKIADEQLARVAAERELHIVDMPSVALLLKAARAFPNMG